ncbi:MAG: SdrD B-like domain-containing protein, partial [Saprospiraceae bacterium]
MFEAQGPGRTCNPLAIQDTIEAVFPLVGGDANNRFEFTRRFSDFVGNNQTSIGASILFKIIEGYLGVDIPDFVEQGLGVSANGINLAFVNINWGITPGVDFRFGVYDQLKEADSAKVNINYQGLLCVGHPEAKFFGCNDTINITTSFDPRPDLSTLQVDPGVLQQEIGMLMDDLTFGLRFFLNFSACIGIPNPTGIGPSCIGYRVRYNNSWALTPEYTVGTIGSQALLRNCDEVYKDGANLGDMLSCFGASLDDVPDFLLEVIKAYVLAQTGRQLSDQDIIDGTDAALTALSMVKYDPNKDQVRYRLPPIPGQIVPEFDFIAGRLTERDLQPPQFMRDTMTVSGTESEFSLFRVDVSSFIDYLIPAALRDSTLTGFQFATRISIGKGLIVIDLVDLNIFLRNSLQGDFKFIPNVTLQSIDLGIPMAYRVGNGVWNSGQIINNVTTGDSIKLVIPSFPANTVPPDLPINNVYALNGSKFTAQTRSQAFLDLGIRFLEFGGLLFGITGGDQLLPPLYKNDRVFSNSIGDTRIHQDYSKTYQNNEIPLQNGSWLLDPDDIPPIVACKDTTVYLNEWGYALVTPESVFDSLNSYDLPVGGTGKVNIVKVIPDTIFCSDYPEVEGRLVTEDDNCNYDTCIFTITVRDTLKPYMGCRNYTVALNETGVHKLDPAKVLIGAIDNCRDITVTMTPDVFTCEDVGEINLVEVTIRDIAGNTNTCIDTVFVIDTIPPALVCPYLPNYPVTRYVDQDLCTYTPDAIEFLPLLTYNDCDVTITYTLTGATTGSGNNNVGGVPFNLGTTIVTYTATDASNNSVSCSFTVIVKDDQAPAFTPTMEPMDLTVECDGMGNNAQLQTWLNNHANAVATDNCTDMAALAWSYKLETIDDNCGGTVIYTYSFTVTDQAGNFATAMARFIIVDTQPPVISVPAQNILAICKNGSLGIEAILDWLNNNGGAVADDVCGNFTWTNNFVFDQANMLCTQGSIDVTFVATDECGNADSTTATIVIDGLDFGDLPDVADNGQYPTTFEHNGARHGVSPNSARTFLGAKVDTELDGNPNLLANGDGDDEDGVVFLTPLMPGQTARIRFNATNQFNQPATIYAFGDFNGDRVLEPITFTTTPTVPANGALVNADYSFTVPNISSANAGVLYFRFRISTDLAAAQPTGLATNGEVEDYRVNLAKIGNLVWQDVNANGRQDLTEEDLGINGVRVALIFAGQNGTFETNLNTFPPVAVGDDQVFQTTTGTYTFVDGEQKNGIYYFNALIEGTYNIVFENPKDLTPTRPNNITTSQDEDKDSDGLPIGNTLLVQTGAFTLQGPLVENEAGIGDQDLANLIDVNQVDGFPDNRVDQRFDVGYYGLDFGDLPQVAERSGVNYKTTLAQNGPRHIIRPDFFLGVCADAEVDGAPNAEAGYKGNGADLGDDATDNDPKSFKVGANCADDEDGVKFITPLIPGYEACIEITYELPDNFNGPDGFLNAWIDYNGNGILDASEQIRFTKLNNIAAPLEPNTNALRLEKSYITQGNGKVTLCFNVPADAQYFQGDMYARFRISDNPRLSPDGILPAETNYPQGRIPYGEVEDYFIPLSKVGNLVWEDRDFDGIQDANEANLGINNVPVALIFSGADGIIQTTNIAQPVGDDRVYHDTTGTFNGTKGIYAFCGLLEDGVSANENYNYQLVIQTPKDMTPTRPNRPAPGAALGSAGDFVDSDFADGTQSDQVVDNVLIGRVLLNFDIPYGQADNRPLNENGIADKGQLTPPNDMVLNFPDEQNDETFDVGFAGLDYGEVLADNNLFAPDGKNDPLEKLLATVLPPVHVIQPGKFLGTCVDAEQAAKVDPLAGSINQVANPPLLPMGDDNMQGAVGQPSNINEAIGAVNCTDDEDGITFLTPIVMGYQACISVRYTLDPAQLNGETWYLRAWSDYNANETFEANEAISFIGLTNNALTPGVNQQVQLCFNVPNDPNLYPGGLAYFRFRLTNNPTLGPDGPEVYGNDPMPAGEIEDHLVTLGKVGNIVWFDNNLDGIQDGLPHEPAVPGVKIFLDYAGPDGNFATTADNTRYEDVTDAEGRYFFCGLIKGNYRLTPEKYDNLALAYESKAHITPVHHILTVPNQGADDDKDSDGTPAITFAVPDLLLTNWRTGEDGFNDQGSVNGYPDARYDESNDFGWIPEPNLEGIITNVGVDFPTSLECGSFNVLADVCIKNTGYKEIDGKLIGASLEKLQATLDLDAPNAYGAAFKKVIKVEIATDKTTATIAPTVSGAYNGTNITNLLDGISGILKAGEVVCIRVTFEINPRLGSAPAMPQAQALVSGKAVNLQGIVIPDMCKSGNPQFVAEDLTSNKKTFEADHAPDFPSKYHDMDGPLKLDDCWKKLEIDVSQNFVVNVTLDEECNASLSAAQLIQRYFPECDLEYPLGGFYRVQILDKEDRRLALGANAKFNAKDFVGDTLRVQVFNVADYCNGVWGYVKFEDKTPPKVVECPPAIVDEVTVKVKVQTLNGTIGSNAALDFSGFTCYAELGQFPACQRFYNVISGIEVDKDDKYTFELEMPTDAGMFSLYQGSFDPDEPCSNIIAQNNLTAYGSIIANPLEARIRIALPLKKDQKYTLVVTTSGADCTPGDPFKIYALSDGDGKIVGGGFGAEQELDRTYDLLCSDVPFIHRKPGSEVYTGAPVILDNCSMDMVEKWFVDGDLINYGKCDTTYFIRKWYAKDRSGNTIGPVCEQHIKFRPPSILDVQRPSMTVPVECDEYIKLDPNGNPTPDIAGRPFVISAFGLHELDEVYCNLGATYEDAAEIGICKGSRKLIRKWTLYNWCGGTLTNPLLLNWKQVIKMGDFTAPLIECPEKDPWDSVLTISTGPFDCTATFLLPEPKITENCSDYTVKGQIIQVVLDKEYDFLGAWTGKYIPREVIKAEAVPGAIVNNIDTGTYILRYLAEDGCGNKRRKDCTLRIEDRTEPLAVVDDQINLSIGGPDAKGIGGTTVEDVDEGSKDNCGPVQLYVDRQFQDIAARDAYLRDIYGLIFEGLYQRTV